VSKQYEHIKRIRKEYGLNDVKLIESSRTIRNLHNAIKKLANDLYSKETHFLLELVQNAEDNEYRKDACLSFCLLKTDPTNTEGSVGALLIQNNEIGFGINNIEAICAVGESTKTKASGYIGEKGIGFKSVFRITSTPHIFSGGYCIRLPEKLEGIDLGYIVPEWVEHVPNCVDKEQTSIILPLDKSDEFNFQKIRDMICQFTPETILFLKKVTKLSLYVEDDYSLDVVKKQLDINELSITAIGNDKGKEICTTTMYLFHEKTFAKPVDLDVKERQSVSHSTISLAFPLHDNPEPGALYAYLPVVDNTGFPFIINADLLLTSSRVEVHQNNKWNLWLRDQIASLITSAITSLVHNDKYKYKMLNFVPLSANHNFLIPIIDPVISSLRNTPIVATEPDNRLCKPGEVSTSVTFRKLLNSKGFPKPLLSYRIVKDELQSQIRKAVWDSLGVETINKETVVECLKDRNWIKKQNFQWILLCYEYLRKSKFEKGTLLKCPIVPVKRNKGVVYSCDGDQPIYFECTQEDRKTLAKRPSCVDKRVDFLDPGFYSLIKDDSELKDWMTKYLEVYPFSIGNYAVIVLKWLIEKQSTISDKEIVLVSSFIVENKNKDADLRELPVLLIDGIRMNIGEILDQQAIQLVVPNSLDPETGWQNVFRNESDREHLLVLSDAYLNLSKESLNLLFNTVRATEYPLLKEEQLTSIFTDNDYDSYSIKSGLFLSDYEINEIKKVASSSTGKTRHLIEYTRKKPLSVERGQITEQLCNSLVKWLSGLGKLAQSRRTSVDKYFQSKISYQYYGVQTKVIDSQTLKFLKESKWLNTTMGYCDPQETFVKDQNVEEILADSVPYVTSELPDNILSMLGVNSDLRTDFLIERLLHHSKMNSGTTSFTEKVYSTLRSRFDTGNSWTTKQQISVLQKEKSILIVKNDDSKLKWVYPSECIWMDRSDMFGDKFIYLSTIYPKLKDFFVSHLKVDEDVQEEHFGILWLNMQDMQCEEKSKIIKTMSMIYERINGVIKSDHLNLDWLNQLKQNAKIYTERGCFENPNKVFIPNDGKLKKLFDECVEFTWLPEKTSYNQWSQLFGFFGVRPLKHSVKVTLDNSQVDEEVKKNRFLTCPCKLLIAMWLKEKNEDLYRTLLDKGLIGKLINTKEYSAAEIKLTHKLDIHRVSEKSECFWDSKASRLLLTQKANKRTIADSITRELCNNSFAEDLKNWIESKLGYSKSECQAVLTEENWQIPDELRQLMNGQAASSEKSDFDESSKEDLSENQPEADIEENADLHASKAEEIGGANNDGSSRSTGPSLQDSSQHQQIKQGSYTGDISGKSSGQGATTKTRSDEEYGFEEDSEAQDSEEEANHEPSFEDDLFSVFNTKDKPIYDNEEWNEDAGKSNNPNSRYEREYDKARDTSDNSRAQKDRYIEVRRRILDGPDPLVRETLYKWYSGKCQICGSTFIQKNGKAFFISHFLVPRRVSDSADMTGNSICLCADHFAQMVYGRIKSPDIIKQLESIDPANESFELDLEINGENLTISYNQQHAIALKAFYEATKKESE
jgi:hypothetical protein